MRCAIMIGLATLMVFSADFPRMASAQSMPAARPSAPQPVATSSAPSVVPSPAARDPRRSARVSPGGGSESILPGGLTTAAGTTTSVAPLTGEVTLGQALAEGAAHSPDVLAAVAEIEVSRARVQQTATEPLQLTFQPAVTQDVPGGAGQVQSLNGGLQKQFSASVASSRRLAALNVQAAEARAETTRRDVSQRIIDGYYALAGAQARTLAAEQNVESANQLLRVARLRQRAGAIGGFEVLRATVETRRAQSELLQSRGVQQQDAIALGAVIGRPVDPMARLSLEPESSPAIVEDQTLARAIAQDPTLSQLRAAFAAARAQLDIARTLRLPSLTIGAGYALERAPSLGRTSNGPTASVGLTMPIIDFGTLRGAEREASTNGAVAELQIAAREVALRAAIDQALCAVGNSRARLEFTGESLRQAGESLRVAQIGFRRGALGTLDVIGARSAVSNSRADKDQARADYAASIARLQTLIGESSTP